MPNISDEQLRQVLFPEEAVKFLEDHPGCKRRAANMYGNASIQYHKKAIINDLDRVSQMLFKLKETADTI